MTTLSLEEEMDELSSAEDFLEFFGLGYDAKVVHVNRLHIMQRYHDYLTKGQQLIADAPNDEALAKIYKTLLAQAYEDFVNSDAQTEKVFKVFHMNEPQTGFVSVEQLLGS